MTSPAGLTQYPFADPNGNPLPFSIGNPYGLVTQAIGTSASSTLTLPTDVTVAVFFATVRCVVSFRGTTPVLANGTFSEDHMIIPKGSVHGILVPDVSIRNISADGSSTGKLYIQLYKPWKTAGIDSLSQRY